MQALQDTDFMILKDFREAAIPMKKSIEGMTREEKIKALEGFAGVFLKRLENNGWPQRDRMVTLIQVWNEA